MSDASPPRRKIHSFVRRDGRISARQRHGLEVLLPGYSFTDSQSLRDYLAVDQRPLTVEIGFGNGDLIVAEASNAPERLFLGMEVYKSGLGQAAQAIEERQINNLRLIEGDAVEKLEAWFPENSISELWLFFPDPWPKAKHHKRRLVQTEFLDLVHSRMTEQSIFRLATDWQPYAEHMLETLEAHPGFENTHGRENFMAGETGRFRTRFESRGLKKGHEVSDLEFRRVVVGSPTTA